MPSLLIESTDSMIILHTTENIFQTLTFLYYSSYPYLEGIKDVFCYKFRRLMIGQSCSAVCDRGGHRDAFSNKRCEAPCDWRGLLSRPLNLERSERQGLFFVVPVDSLVVDSIFKQNENVTIALMCLSIV